MKRKINDRKYMQMAIDEMMESRSEHKNKTDPMVGAVIADKNGKLLGKTHRGSLRKGDHAEYTLIERKLGDRNLEGSTLYVTLEPCSTRSTSKTPCAKRIVDARIKKVYIGMVDPNPDIEGHGIGYLQRNDIEVDFFDKDLIDKIREENKNFIKHYDKIMEKLTDTEEIFEGPSSREKEAVLTATIDDLSKHVILNYLKMRNKTYKVPSQELWTFFNKKGFVITLPDKDSFIPTIAGLLLFGEAPEDFLQCKVKLEAHVGAITASDDVGGPILLLPDKINNFLNKNMRMYTEIREFKRVEIPEYPLEALREAIINAIVHRDYSKEGTHIFINMFQNYIEINSPGLPLKPITLEKIRTYNAPTYNRNPRIAETFNYMKMMEERGWGFKKIRDILQEHGLPAPEFNYDNGYFVVTIFAKTREPGFVQIAPDLLKKLTKRQRKIIDYIIKEKRINRLDCAKKFKITNRTALRDLNKLVELGIIEKKGSGPGTHYVLI